MIPTIKKNEGTLSLPVILIDTHYQEECKSGKPTQELFRVVKALRERQSHNFDKKGGYIRVELGF